MGVANSLFLVSVASTISCTKILLGSEVPTLDLSHNSLFEQRMKHFKRCTKKSSLSRCRSY